ncbi:hypothetical protein [Streptomyces sp. MS2.AVA.5]|uniref:Uncharacterized protein n=1 Tax=Streptomyces achmelvichensis TaxID=3134111 RepID=A0ACC6PLY5_9ACTN
MAAFADAVGKHPVLAVGTVIFLFTINAALAADLAYAGQAGVETFDWV